MKRTWYLTFAFLFAAAFAFGYLGTYCLTALAQEESDKEIRELFDQGKKAFYEGRYEDATKLLEKVLALRPSSKLALELRKEAGFQFFVEGLSKEGDLGLILRKLLEIIEKPPVIERPEKEKIVKYLELMKSEDYQTKYMAVENILSEVGQYVCPFCVEALGDRRNDEYRTDIIILLSRMEQDAVLPVIEMLNSMDSFTRQNAAIVLGHIGDPRAAAALKARYEDPKEDEHVKGAAKEALIAITRAEDVERLEPAKRIYLKLAERYYYDDLSIIINNYKEWLYWFWSEKEEAPENKLSYRPADRWEYNELLAEEACYRALTIDPNYDEAWTLLLCVYYGELNEVQSALDVVLERRDAGGAIPEIAIENLQKKRAVNEKCWTISYARGRKQLYKALRRSLDDRNSLNAVSCIQAIRDVKDDGSMLPETAPPPSPAGVPTPISVKPVPEKAGAKPLAPVGQPRDVSAAPLIAALNYPDKRVRYAAAEALARMNPKQRFLDHEKVIPTLIEALGESAVRVILIIESDEQIANRMVGFIHEIGYMPILERDGLAGLSRVKRFPSQDLVIIATDLLDYKAFEIIDAMKEDYRTQDVPIFVMCPETQLRETGALYTGKADEIIAKKVEKQDLRDKIDRAFQTEKARRDAPARAIQVAKIAAEALSSVDLANANFDLRQAIRPLEEVLMKGTTDQPKRLDYDVVRLPAILALSRLGTDSRETLDALCSIFTNKDNKKEIRCAAADAIGEICRPTGEGTPMVLTSLSEGLSDSELDVQRAAAIALGKCSTWTGEEYFTRMFVPQRVHKNEK
jgi:DNA-binding response OmpR family regulator